MSISPSTRKAYSEINEFIGLLTVEEQNEIPKKLRDFFKKEKDNEYVKKINPNIAIEEQNLMQETLILIAMLNLKYWCKDEQEKEKLKSIYSENERKYQEKLREKYNLDNIFSNRKNREEKSEKQVNSVAMVEYKEPIFEKIKKIVVNIFKYK